MKVYTVPTGIMRANCYIIEDGNCAVVIDPGYMEREIADYALENPEKIKYILLTHRHFDHVNAAAALRKMTGAGIAVHKSDECGLLSDECSLAAMAGGFYGMADGSAKADVLLNGGENIEVGSMKFHVIHTPGHTVGGVCYLIGNSLFSGDTLFKNSIGRTDFEGGSIVSMRHSLDVIRELPDETVVYPGHGEITDLRSEKKCNPMLNGDF